MSDWDLGDILGKGGVVSPYLPLIGMGLSLFGGKDKKEDTSRIEYYDPYQGDAAKRRQELWDMYQGLMMQAQGISAGDYPGAMGESADYYRQLAANKPEAVDKYIGEVLGGKYLNLANNPYYQGMMAATRGTFTRGMGDIYSQQNVLGAGLGGGGASSLGRERMLRQNTPAFADEMRQLNYQAYMGERGFQQDAAGMGLTSYGMQQNALSTGAAGLGQLGMFGAQLPYTAAAGLAGLLPSWETRVGGQVGQGYVQDPMSQIGSSIMNLYGTLLGSKTLPVTPPPPPFDPSTFPRGFTQGALLEDPPNVLDDF